MKCLAYADDLCILGIIKDDINDMLRDISAVRSPFEPHQVCVAINDQQ